MTHTQIEIARLEQHIDDLRMRQAILKHAFRRTLRDRVAAPRMIAGAVGLGAVLAMMFPHHRADQPKPGSSLTRSLAWLAELAGSLMTLRAVARTFATEKSKV